MDDNTDTRVTPARNPVHQFPVEVLSYIFKLAVGKQPSELAIDRDFTGEDYATPKQIHRSIQAHPFRPLLYISKVCHYWRHVAVSTPSLWSTIVIRPFWTPAENRIKSHLERSRNHPIDIQIHLKDYIRHPSFFIPSFFDQLLPHVHRWHTIEVFVDRYRDTRDELIKCRMRDIDMWDRYELPSYMANILDTLFDAPFPTAPQLTSVVLYDCHYGDRTPGCLRGLGSSAPHLKTLSLTHVDAAWGEPWISSASNLTTLQLTLHYEGSISWTRLATILRGAVQLKVISLSGTSSGLLRTTEAESTSGDIRLVELRQLAFHLRTSVAVQLLHRCYMPALQKLTMYPATYRQDSDDAFMAQLTMPQLPSLDTATHTQFPLALEPSHNLLTNIEYLCLGRFRFPRIARHIEAVYENLNNVITLVLQVDLHIQPAFLELLDTQPQQHSDIKLPRLENLCICSYATTSDGYWNYVPNVCKLARRRYDLGVPLKTLVMRQFTYRDEFEKDASWMWCHKNLESFYFGEFERSHE